MLCGAIAVQLAAAAYGIAAQSVAGLVIALGGAGLLLVATGLLVLRFQQINGVRVDGLTSQLALAPGASASLFYLGALAMGVWAAFEAQWGLVAIAAASGGLGCALGLRR